MFDFINEAKTLGFLRRLLIFTSYEIACPDVSHGLVGGEKTRPPYMPLVNHTSGLKIKVSGRFPGSWRVQRAPEAL